MKVYSDIASAAPKILIPNKNIDPKKWAVVACDQFTSEPDYWNAVNETVGDNPSTLHMVLPEVYLPRETEEEHDQRLKNIKEAINSYLAGDVFDELPEGFILIDRSTSLHPSRKGLVLALDLEQYSFAPGNKEKIRATEGTVLSRIPPRVKIRANAPIEIPHIMLLIDDPEKTVVEAAFDKIKASGKSPCYDTDLMQDSGHLVGYHTEADSEIGKGIVDALSNLAAKNDDGLLYLVGDGNHSLASAKAHWDNIKTNLSEEERYDHPARYALAEVVNIHDKGLDFEPIHRVVFNVEAEAFLSELANEVGLDNVLISDKPVDDLQNFELVGLKSYNTPSVFVNVQNPPHSLAVGTVQIVLDKMLEDYEGMDVDYIHGLDAVMSLTENGTNNNTGILLPAISKDTFFATVSTEGVFPRKTFSMGEAFEKRFYFDAKKIEL